MAEPEPYIYPRPLRCVKKVKKSPVLVATRGVIAEDNAIASVHCIGLPNQKLVHNEFLDEVLEATRASGVDRKRRCGGMILADRPMELHFYLWQQEREEYLDSFKQWCLERGHQVPSWDELPTLLGTKFKAADADDLFNDAGDGADDDNGGGDDWANEGGDDDDNDGGGADWAGGDGGGGGDEGWGDEYGEEEEDAAPSPPKEPIKDLRLKLKEKRAARGIVDDTPAKTEATNETERKRPAAAEDTRRVEAPWAAKMPKREEPAAQHPWASAEKATDEPVQEEEQPAWVKAMKVAEAERASEKKIVGNLLLATQRIKQQKLRQQQQQQQQRDPDSIPLYEQLEAQMRGEEIQPYQQASPRPRAIVPPPPRVSLTEPRASIPSPVTSPPPRVNLPQAKAPIPPPSPDPQPPPQEEEEEEITLKEHFHRCQTKYGRDVSVGDDMLYTWRLAGHNEATLRNLCREKRPTNQNALKLMLMRELQNMYKPPTTHSVTDLIEETAEYFLPSQNTPPLLRLPATPKESKTPEVKVPVRDVQSNKAAPPSASAPRPGSILSSFSKYSAGLSASRPK